MALNANLEWEIGVDATDNLDLPLPVNLPNAKLTNVNDLKGHIVVLRLLLQDWRADISATGR